MKYEAKQINNDAIGWCVVDEKQNVFTRGLMSQPDAELMAVLLNNIDQSSLPVKIELIMHKL